MTEPTISTWSFSRLVVFEQCPYHAYRKYALKIPEADFIDKTAMERGSAIHNAAEQYIKGEIDSPGKDLKKIAPQLENLRTLYHAGEAVVEDPWAFTKDWTRTGWFDDDVWVRLALDAIRFEKDGDAPVFAHLYDWKTGRKDGNEVKHTAQGRLYALGAFLWYPTLEAVTYEFLYTDQPESKNSMKRTVTRDQAIKVILPSWQQRAKLMTEATSFPPKPNRINCRFCPYGPNPNKGDGSCEYGVPWQ